MPFIKGGPPGNPLGRPKGSGNKLTNAELVERVKALEAELAQLRAQREIDTKRLDEVLFSLGEMSARSLLGKDGDE